MKYMREASLPTRQNTNRPEDVGAKKYCSDHVVVARMNESIFR